VHVSHARVRCERVSGLPGLCPGEPFEQLVLVVDRVFKGPGARPADGACGWRGVVLGVLGFIAVVVPIWPIARGGAVSVDAASVGARGARAHAVVLRVMLARGIAHGAVVEAASRPERVNLRGKGPIDHVDFGSSVGEDGGGAARLHARRDHRGGPVGPPDAPCRGRAR
jgi:hypothetical protein